MGAGSGRGAVMGMGELCFCGSRACLASGGAHGMQPAPAAFASQSCLMCRNSSGKAAGEPARSSEVDLTFHLCLCFLNKKKKKPKQTDFAE